jgi:hypothetical protein
LEKSLNIKTNMEIAYSGSRVVANYALSQGFNASVTKAIAAQAKQLHIQTGCVSCS